MCTCVHNGLSQSPSLSLSHTFTIRKIQIEVHKRNTRANKQNKQKIVNERVRENECISVELGMHMRNAYSVGANTLTKEAK